ncbi:MAG TPA: ferrous iron transport protein A [Chloroflexi bacterium]|nr:ferrous iron transport protein A [Chloroflexota bacterium]
MSPNSKVRKDKTHLAVYRKCDINGLMIHLLQISPGTTVRVIDFDGGINLRSKLTQYGIHPGDCVRVLRKAPLGGPLLVECNQREIALGRGVADKIIVEKNSCDSL